MATVTESELEDELSQNITVDETFRHNQPIRWPIDQNGRYLWRKLSIEFRGFAVGVGDENPDEPEFIITFQVSPDSVGYVRYPTGVIEPPEVSDGQTRQIIQPLFEFSELDDGDVHRAVVICSAIDSDADSLWERFLDSLSSDVRATVGTVSASVGGPAAAAAGAAASPRALMDFFLSKLESFLTDDPEEIGEKTLVDLSKVWRRQRNQRNWTALSFLKHQIRGRLPWYLTMWRIELDAGPRWWIPSFSAEQDNAVPGGSGTEPAPGAGPEGAPGGAPEAPVDDDEVGYRVDEPIGGLLASIAVASDDRLAAALRVLQGADIVDVAASYDMHPATLRKFVSLMTRSGAPAFQGMLERGLLAEVGRLRDELASLSNNQKKKK